MQYQFYFGDGPALSQPDSTFAHFYTAPRHYDAHGVAVIHGREITSGLIPVDVQDVNLAANLVDPPAKAHVGHPVTFTAESRPASALTEYDFVFSDSKHSGFQSARTYQRSFEPKGTYSVMVVARGGQGREARSEFSHLDIVPASQWPLVAAVSVVVLGGGALLQLSRGRWPFPKPQTSFIPHSDPGEQSLDAKGHLPAREIRLRPVISYGEQTIVTSAPTVN